jgi:hypothetical protein
VDSGEDRESVIHDRDREARRYRYARICAALSLFTTFLLALATMELGGIDVTWTVIPAFLAALTFAFSVLYLALGLWGEFDVHSRDSLMFFLLPYISFALTVWLASAYKARYEGSASWKWIVDHAIRL